MKFSLRNERKLLLFLLGGNSVLPSAGYTTDLHIIELNYFPFFNLMKKKVIKMNENNYCCLPPQTDIKKYLHLYVCQYLHNKTILIHTLTHPYVCVCGRQRADLAPIASQSVFHSRCSLFM